jgi:hypothetical protein
MHGKSSVNRWYNLSICVYSTITVYLPVDRWYNLIYVSMVMIVKWDG